MWTGSNNGANKKYECCDWSVALCNTRSSSFVCFFNIPYSAAAYTSPQSISICLTAAAAVFILLLKCITVVNACVFFPTLTNTSCLCRHYVCVVDTCQKCQCRPEGPLTARLKSKTLNIPFYHHKWQISRTSAALQGTDFILMQFYCFLILALSPEGWRGEAWKDKIHFLLYLFQFQ